MARTQTVSILFCDLVASTERRARVGDDAFDDFTMRFMIALRNCVDAAEGRVISTAGDGLMVAFPASVADALACATSMHRAAAALDPRDPPLLRIGISSGEVAEDGADYSGMPIVEAARLEAAADPGKTLASAVVRSLVGTRRAFRFRDVGPLALKGLPAPLHTVEVLDEEVADVPSPEAAPPATRRLHTRATIAVLAALIVTLAVIGAIALDDRATTPVARRGVKSPTDYTPRFERAACYDPDLATRLSGTCGWLVVPQDRAKPRGKQIRIHATRVPARTPGASAPPTIDLCDCEDLESSPARDHSELIQTQPRGHELSKPALTCPEMHAAAQDSLALPSDDPKVVARGRDAMGRCYRRLVRGGIDPAQYNYDNAAQDVLDLMVALNIPQADLVTSDQGSVEAFDVMRRAPDAVRSLTLVNPAPPGTTGFTNPTADLSAAFERYGALCTADARCAASYPDLGASWSTDHARFESSPVLIPKADFHDANSPGIPLLVDGPRAADGLALALNDDTVHPLLPAGLADPTGAALRSAATGAQVNPGFAIYPDAAWGGYASYVCSYDIHTVDPAVDELTRRTLPSFVRGYYLHWAQWCEAWDVPDLSETLGADVASKVPALLLRGDLSPDGNRGWIRAVRRGLPNAQSALFPTLGGGILSQAPPCLNALRRTFLAHPGARLGTGSCEDHSPAIDFVLPNT